MPYQGLPQAPQSRLASATATAKRMAVAACGLLIYTCAGCASLPDAALEKEMISPQAVEFDNARGPVSASKSTGIIEGLKRKSGDIDILEKHLAMEQAINADSPLVLGNKLILLQDGPATYQAMFAAIGKAKDHINLETYISKTMRSAGSSQICCWKGRPQASRST